MIILLINQLENNALVTYLMLQRYRYDPNALIQQMRQIINSIDPYFSKNYLKNFFDFILEIVELTEKRLIEIFEPINPEIKSEFMSPYDLLVAKGEAKGKAEGKAEMILAAYQNNIAL